MTNADPPTQLGDILSQTVFIRGTNVPFRELTAADARARADELRAAIGWGPTARVAPVALAWAELARTLEQAPTPTVGDLDAELLVKLAPRLWIVPPGGSLL
jgi:hypothetical protein